MGEAITLLILEAVARLARLSAAREAAQKADPTPEESSLVDAVMEENRADIARLTGH